MAQHPYNDSIQLVIKDALAQGWRHTRTEKGHHQFFAPDGESIVTTSGTPSDHRAMDNFIADMRRKGFKLPSEVHASTSLGDALRSALRGEEGRNGGEAVAAHVTPPRGAAGVIMRRVMRAHPDKVFTRATLFAAVRTQHPSINEKTMNSALSHIVSGDSGFRSVGWGEYTYRDSPTATPKVERTAEPAVHSMAQGAGGEDEHELDEALAALGRIESVVSEALSGLAKIETVVRRHRDIARQLAALKKLLNGNGG